MNRTLNDDFTLEALAHIETRRPEIPIFHILASVGEMVTTPQDTARSSAQSNRTALIEWLNNNHTKSPRKWMDLVQHFKDIGAGDEATKIEQLFVSVPT